MTLLAVRPDLPQPDIGSVLDALAKHQTVELDCAGSPTHPAIVEVESRHDLEELLVEFFPFRPKMAPVDDSRRVAVGIWVTEGPPLAGDGDSLCAAIDALVANALAYVERWEHELRLDPTHQRYWGWVYRLLLAGDDNHIRAALLDRAA
jgi:hypothetical protein